MFEERKGKQRGWCPVNGGGEWRVGVRGKKSYGGRSWPEKSEGTDAWWDCPGQPAEDLLVRSTKQCDPHYV